MMHKLTLITYLIMWYLKKHSKNDQTFSLHPIGNCYSYPSFSIFQRNLVPKFLNSSATKNSSEYLSNMIDQILPQNILENYEEINA